MNPLLMIFSNIKSVKNIIIITTIIILLGSIYFKGRSDGIDLTTNKFEALQNKVEMQWAKALSKSARKNNEYSKEVARISGMLEATHDNRKERIKKIYLNPNNNTDVFDSDELLLLNEAFKDPRSTKIK